MEPSQTSESAEHVSTKMWRVANGVMAVFFVLCTYVQLNDPDPYIWVPIYTVPALLCVTVAVKDDSIDNAVWRMVCIIHVGCCVLGVVFHLVLVLEIMAGKLYNPLMHEEGRELAGLAIIIVWLTICWFNPFSRRVSNLSTRALTGLLILSCIVGLAPLFMWSLCFIEGLDSSLMHCNGMFPGMLGGGAVS